jgi:TonB family protein
MRESNRTYIVQGIVLTTIVVIHGMIIYALVTHMITVTTATPVQAMLVTVVDKPRRPPVELKFTPPALLKPVPSLAAMPQAAVEAPVPAAAPQALLPGQRPDSLSSSVAVDEHAIGSNVSGAASNSGDGGSDIGIAHRVQPIYPAASVRAKEQGYVTAEVLIDENGHASKVEVVQSSGFRRLDQSVVDALRQWTFTRRANGSPLVPTWSRFVYGFHLASWNVFDRSTMSLTLVPFDPAVAEQIRAAAVPIVGPQIPTPDGADALRRLIARLQSIAPRYARDFAGPLPTIKLLAKLGAVQSIQFLGMESRGLDVDETKQSVDLEARNSQESQWELYKVTQQGGASEWLIAVTRKGIIRNAQTVVCPNLLPGISESAAGRIANILRTTDCLDEED